jgi:glycosyltransferase involved in cell wall biosynthesis
MPDVGEGMRILHVIPRVVRRGAEVFAAQLAEALTAHDGSRNLLFPLFGPAEGAPAANVRVVPGARPAGRTGRLTWADPGAVARMRAGLSRLRPDLVVAHGGEPLKYAVLADPRGRMPIAYRKISHAVGSRGERLLARFMARAAVILAVSEGLADELVDRFLVDRARVRVIPTARRRPPRLEEAERAAFRASIGAKPDVPLLAWAGRLTPEKQPGAALQAFAVIRSRFGACTLALCGEGPLRASIERAAAAAGDGALVLGSRDDAHRVIAAADVFLSTSQTEGAPGVLVEAGLAGVPVAAFDVGEVAQIVRDGETGVLAPPGFVEVLAVLVVDLLRTPERREAMGAAAREACAPFSIDAVVADYAAAFSEVVRTT